MIVTPVEGTIATSNTLGLSALHLWACNLGEEAAAEAFGIPRKLVPILAPGSLFADELGAFGHSIWSLRSDFVLDLPLGAGQIQSDALPGPAVTALWQAQETFMSCVAAHWRASPLVAAGVMEVGEVEASWIASLRAPELRARARTPTPFIRLRPDLLGAERGGGSLALRLLVLAALQRAGLPLDDLDGRE